VVTINRRLLAVQTDVVATERFHPLNAIPAMASTSSARFHQSLPRNLLRLEALGH
jgi:hypothetical protein